MNIRNQTTLYFIRHGETNSNKKHIRQGVQIDEYLDSRGIVQIQSISHLIEFLNLDILFTSYLHRAEETTAIINQSLKNPVTIYHDFRLRERDFGSLTGKSEDEWETLIPGFMEAEKMQNYDYHPFGGEDVNDVRQRAFSAILDIAKNQDHKNVGIVTHDGIIALLLFHFPDIPRIYRGESDLNKDVANADIYEWGLTEDKIANLKSLLK
jgi:broad specificity phosphatase PhoE